MLSSVRLSEGPSLYVKAQRLKFLEDLEMLSGRHLFTRSAAGFSHIIHPKYGHISNSDEELFVCVCVCVGGGLRACSCA